MDAVASDVLPQVLSEEDLDLQTTQRRISTENIDLHSPSAPSNSEASRASASSSSTLQHPAILTTGSSPSSGPTAAPEHRVRVPDAALLGWLIRNVSAAALRGLIDRSFLLGPRNSATNIQMVREAAQRHGVAAEDVEECVKKVFMGAAELATLVNYDMTFRTRCVECFECAVQLVIELVVTRG
jgi:hypothetical protein